MFVPHLGFFLSFTFLQLFDRMNGRVLALRSDKDRQGGEVEIGSVDYWNGVHRLN